jgi:formimidoylglutamate deiminase
MAGLTEKRGPDASDSFWTWRQLMFRFLDRLTPEHVEAIAAFVQMEMLEAGYSANVEFHYLHHQPGGSPYANIAEMAERIVAASALTGMGLTLLPVHYQYGGCDKRPLGPGQIRFGNTLDTYAELHARSPRRSACCRATPGSASPRTACGPWRRKTLPITQTLREKIRCTCIWPNRSPRWRKSKPPVASGLSSSCSTGWSSNARHCFIHCTQMLPHETEGLARSGAVAGLCPITESSLGDGIFDGVRWLGAGGSIAVGSDSNIRISLSEELRTLDYSQRLRDHSRAALATPEHSTGRRLFDAVNDGGAKSSGRNNGALAVGKLADMMALDAGAVDLIGRSGDTILDCYMFAGDDRMVEDVWSAGRHMVTKGRHVKREAIVSAYARTMKELGEAI